MEKSNFALRLLLAEKFAVLDSVLGSAEKGRQE